MKEKYSCNRKRRVESAKITKQARRALLCVFFLFTLFLSNAQKDSITHYKVKFTNGDYTFTPADGYLFVGSKNKLKITNSRHSNFEVKITNGNVTKLNDSMYVIDNLTTFGTTLVSVLEKDIKGKKRLAVNRPYSVIAYPKVKFSGVPCDSAMPAIKLATGTMSIHYKNIDHKLPVTSFKMEFYEKDKFILDSSFTNRLSKKMLAYIEKLKPGSLVYMSDIRYKDPNGTEHTEPIYRVFIIPENKVVKFGMNN
jgi:hypothetical protein